MPLSSSSLALALRKFLDPTSAEFLGHPADGMEAAERWAGAVASYLGAVTPPTSTAPAAEAAMRGALAGMDAPGAATEAIPQALAVGAAAIAAGMLSAPAPAVPPPVPFVLPLAAVDGSDAAAYADILAGAIHAWAITGSANAGTPWA